MKYLLLLLFCLSLQTVFAQENRRAATQTPVDSATIAADRFESRLTRLREALDKNDTSTSVSCHDKMLGDIRAAIEREEQKAPESQRLTAMQGILEKIDNFTFDPAKPADLKSYLTNFDDFLNLLRKE